MTPDEQLKSALAEVEKLRAALVVKDAALAEKDDEISSLKAQLVWLRKKVFGQMTEKHLPIDPVQLLLFDQEQMTDEERAELASAAAKAEEVLTKTITVKVKPTRRDLNLSGLTVDIVDIYPEGTTDESGNLKDGYVEIGTEETSRLERIPARTYVARVVRHKVMAAADKGKAPEERVILTPELPLSPVAKCMAGASVLTDIIVVPFVWTGLSPC